MPSVFQRMEQKYLVTDTQRAALEELFREYMVPDEFGESTVCSIYYDTPDYRLIRRSLEKPVYKEKLRVRSYGSAAPDDPVFLEMKRKFKGVVYKRRVSIPCRDAEAFLSGALALPDTEQIPRELTWFRDYYGTLRPAMALYSDRCAWFGKADRDVRITMDRNIRWRIDDLTLTSPAGGEPILPPGTSLMEIKVPAAMPLWLTAFLSENKIYRTPFSKYGNAYSTLLRRNIIESRVEKNVE